MAVQAGSNFTWGHDFSAKVAGRLLRLREHRRTASSPFVPLTTSDQGSTDDSRPAFAQKGNTYFPIRDILSDRGQQLWNDQTIPVFRPGHALPRSRCFCHAGLRAL